MNIAVRDRESMGDGGDRDRFIENTAWGDRLGLWTGWSRPYRLLVVRIDPRSPMGFAHADPSRGSRIRR
jgi:hypothetical protein